MTDPDYIDQLVGFSIQKCLANQESTPPDHLHSLCCPLSKNFSHGFVRIEKWDECAPIFGAQCYGLRCDILNINAVSIYP